MTIAILGMGKSLANEDVSYLEGKCRVVCINETFKAAPWGDWLYAADHNWWDHYIDEVRESFSGELWTQARIGDNPRPGQYERANAEAKGINYATFLRGPGFSTTPGEVFGGASSGYQAMQLAVQWGAERIILLGFDGCRGTWLNGRPRKFRKDSPYHTWKKHYEYASKHCPVPIINCSPNTSYNCFQTARLRDVL